MVKLIKTAGVASDHKQSFGKKRYTRDKHSVMLIQYRTPKNRVHGTLIILVIYLLIDRYM